MSSAGIAAIPATASQAENDEAGGAATATAPATLLRRTLLVTALLTWPLIPHVPYDFLNTAVLACEYCIAALSLVLLVGMVGQISLCQAALIGMGAFVSALATKRLGVEFPFTLLVGMAAGGATAAAIGVVALRVRGLYLAVATLIFAYMCDRYLFVQPWLVESQSGTSIPFQTIGKPGTLPYFDLADAHVFYYVALVVAILALYAVANLRDSRIGRAFAAVRGSEVAAASLGISVMRFKLLGFACAGALAGLAGSVTLIGSRTAAPDQFNFMNSLYFLAIAVVGGLRSVGGAVASSLLFALLVGELFFRSPTLADYLDVISSGVLIAVLLFFRGGLGAVPERIAVAWGRLRPRMAGPRAALPPAVRSRLTVLETGFTAAVHRALAPLRRRAEAGGAVVADMPPDDEDGPLDIVGVAAHLRRMAQPLALHVEPDLSESDDGADADSIEAMIQSARSADMVAGQPGLDGRRLPVLLSAQDITVRFGGLVAVNDVSMQVGAGEIVGLIGPNGAGKTTLFNSILGLNQPTDGRVALFGHDVTEWDVHRRAALGVGRTFQILQLFRDLSVFDNLLVATHLQNRTGLWGSLAVTGGAQRSDRSARERVTSVLEMMGLQQHADRSVAGLPFGVLRLVEIARTLVTGARLVCFDEPASGLDSSETERVIEWFRFLRQIGITLLVIEHDVDMVVRLCDHIYVLDQGRLIADGPPERIQRDPAVIASYLGAPVEVA